MKTNTELKFAAIVGLLMVIICIIILIVQNSRKNDLVDLKVYKHFGNINEEIGYYSDCNITTEEMLKINKEVKRVEKLGEDVLTVGTIVGEYKVVVGDSFYAFDNADDKVIFRGSDNTLHYFDGTLYQTIIDRCEG